jgi:hypothetical protein
MGDALLKPTGAGNLFTVFGEPDITLDRTADGWSSRSGASTSTTRRPEPSIAARRTTSPVCS